MTDDKPAEESKRERNWDPAERWRVIQATIAWSDLQRHPPRNSPEGCLREQAKLTNGGSAVGTPLQR